MIRWPSEITIRRRRSATLAALALAMPALGAGGDDPATAVDLSDRPFPIIEYGDTCDNTNVYAEMCPYGNWAPDEWFSYWSMGEVELTISLCESGYDTLMFVLNEDLDLVACNDDACSTSQGDPYRSRIDCLPMSASQLYYILVDGYVDSCGPYELIITQCFPCPADVNADGTVDVLDLLMVLGAWGLPGGPSDINGDGIVDVLDLLEVLAAWGPCP